MYQIHLLPDCFASGTLDLGQSDCLSVSHVEEGNDWPGPIHMHPSRT